MKLSYLADSVYSVRRFMCYLTLVKNYCEVNHYIHYIMLEEEKIRIMSKWFYICFE